MRTDPSGPNHISLALIGMGEDPSRGQMAKVKVTKWYGFQNCMATHLPKSKQMRVDEAFWTGMYEV